MLYPNCSLFAGMDSDTALVKQDVSPFKFPKLEDLLEELREEQSDAFRIYYPANSYNPHK